MEIGIGWYAIYGIFQDANYKNRWVAFGGILICDLGGEFSGKMNEKSEEARFTGCFSKASSSEPQVCIFHKNYTSFCDSPIDYNLCESPDGKDWRGEYKTQSEKETTGKVWCQIVPPPLNEIELPDMGFAPLEP